MIKENIETFCYGVASSTNKPIVAGGEPVVRLVMLTGAANIFEQMICLTRSGKILLRSLDGRKICADKSDVYLADTGAAPLIVRT